MIDQRLDFKWIVTKGIKVWIAFMVFLLLVCIFNGLNLWSVNIAGGGSGVGSSPSFQTFGQAYNYKSYRSSMTPVDFIQQFHLKEAQKEAHYGEGQTIALFEQDPYFSSTAFMTFCEQFSSSDPELLSPIHIELLSGQKTLDISHSTASTEDNETQMDVEWAHVVAPKSNIVIINVGAQGNSLSQVEQEFSKLHVTVASSSIAKVEEEAFARDPFIPKNSGIWYGTRNFYQWIKQYPFFIASGDQPGFVSVATIDPTSVIVGGIDSNKTLWSSEGRGSAILLSMGNVLQWKAGHHYPFRASPDVVWLAGEPGVYVDLADGWVGSSGGTSLASPSWAGLWALANNVHETRYGSALPKNANQVLYQDAIDHPGDFINNSKATWTPGWGLGYPNSQSVVDHLGMDILPVSNPGHISGVIALWPLLFVILCAVATLWLIFRYSIELFKRLSVGSTQHTSEHHFRSRLSVIFGLFLLLMMYSQSMRIVSSCTGKLGSRLVSFIYSDAGITVEYVVMLIGFCTILTFLPTDRASDENAITNKESEQIIHPET